MDVEGELSKGKCEAKATECTPGGDPSRSSILRYEGRLIAKMQVLELQLECGNFLCFKSGGYRFCPDQPPDEKSGASQQDQ